MTNQGSPGTSTSPFSCLIVEDDAVFADVLAGVVARLGGVTTICGSIADALRATREGAFDLLLLDNHLPDGKIYDSFPRLTRWTPEVPAIMLTGLADLSEAVDLTRNGLLDYLSKPVDLSVLEATLRRACLRLRRPEAAASLDTVQGNSSAMREVQHLLRDAARHVEAVVLITGESGVGKDVVARALHRQTFSTQADSVPYVPVNCAAIPTEMFEAELFGAERGAYTGADRRRAGLVAAAQQGTLFLDEIGEVPLPLQAKLLRFLESREYRPLGSAEMRHFGGRVVAATNRSLRDEVSAGRFREDLLFRIEVFSIEIPPLRERRDDIPHLAIQLLAQLAGKYGRPAPILQEADLARLQAHNYPGNVRELRNILERSLLRTPPDSHWLAVDATAIGRGKPRSPDSPTTPPLHVAVNQVSPPVDLTPIELQEYRLIQATLAETGGAIRRTAARLGLSPQALLRRLEKWPALRPPSPRA